MLVDGGDLVGIFTVSQIVRGYFQSAYLGYYASARHAGKGLMSEAMALVLDHAFGPLSLHRLEANIQPGNAPSIALARGAGFRLEGFSPRYLLIGGRWRDHERYAITADEHAQNRATGRALRTGRAATGSGAGSAAPATSATISGSGTTSSGSSGAGCSGAGSASSSGMRWKSVAQDLQHRRRVERGGRVVERVQPHRRAARSGGSPRARAAA